MRVTQWVEPIIFDLVLPELHTQTNHSTYYVTRVISFTRLSYISHATLKSCMGGVWVRDYNADWREP